MKNNITILPKISIITSCFNAETYIEATLKSVLDQDYANLQFIVIDGGSSDGTLAILNRYLHKITILVSEPDDGQYHGIAKGMDLADGDILAWINADDCYFPWTFSVVGEIFSKYGEVNWIIGTPAYSNLSGQCSRISSVAASCYPVNDIINGWYRSGISGYLQQESMFWRKSLWKEIGGLNLKYGLAADFDLWCRFAKCSELVSVAIPLTMFRRRPGEQRSSVGLDVYEKEVIDICSKLDQPFLLVKIFSEKFEILRHLFRIMRWKKGPVIFYSTLESAWKLVRVRVPISRVSLIDMYFEFKTRGRLSC
jgi:glycosyltransferase involved in cell wall biosynthesis